MGNKPSRIDKQSIDIHNETTAKSKLKILLFGSNTGKSQWFNARTDEEFLSKIEAYMTFKIESFTIGDKLPDIKAVIYDTPRNSIYFDDTLQYISSADGLILTYNIHDIESLYYLEECIHKIKQTISKHTPCILLGIQEFIVDEYSTANLTHCADAAQLFAIKYNLFHLEINITQNIEAKQPYLYLLRKMLNQRQTVLSPYDHQVNDLRPSIVAAHQALENKTDPYLMPYSFRAFASEKSRESKHELQAKAMQPLYDDYDACEIKMDELDEKVALPPNDDTVCQMEFERFFESSLGTKRSSKYLYQFKAKQYNDIRLIDPDIFDDDWFESGEIEMSLLDKKLFKKEVQKYNSDYIRFESMLFELNMTEKYHKQFVNRGIATFWSLYHHIRCMEDVKDIIQNAEDARMIWTKLKIMNAVHEEQVEGEHKVRQVTQLPWIANDVYIGVGNSSDSDDLYTKPN